MNINPVLNHGFWMFQRGVIHFLLNGIQKKVGAARSCIAGNTDLLQKRLMEMSEDQPGKDM